MKQFTKYAAVAVAGYFVGIYAMKYEMLKAIVDKYDKQNQEDSKEDTKEEA